MAAWAPFPDLLRKAIHVDEDLGGAVWRCVIAPQLSGDNLATYEDQAEAYPQGWVGLSIQDYTNANA
jgi:hypothetical protein